MCFTNISPQAKHAETDPRHGMPAIAHFQQPERASFMCGLYYSFNNLRFKQTLTINDVPSPVSSVVLCFNRLFET